MHLKPPKRFHHLIVVCLLAATLCSCSRLKLGYRFADLLIASKAHHYLKLKPDQDRVLKAEIGDYMRWHRKAMLPAYAAACRRLALGFRGAEKPEANIDAVMPLLNGLYAQTLLPLAKPAAGLLAHLRAPQIEFLEKALDKDQAEKRKQYLADPEEAARQRVKRALAYVTEFSGPLSRDQEARIKELSLALHVPMEAWLLDRDRRGKQLLALLKEKKGEPEIEACLRDWWQHGREANAKPDPSRVDPVELKAYFLGVMELLSPQQRELAARHCEDYARDFEELAAMDRD